MACGDAGQYVLTSRDDVALIQVPADVLAEFRAAVETRCPNCRDPMYRVTACGLCVWDALVEGAPLPAS